MPDSVVITGMGIVSPIGCGESAFWDALCSGRTGAATVTGFDTSELTRSVACQVKEPIESNKPMGRAAKLAVHAAREAVSQSGCKPQDLKKNRVATIVGTTMGETEFIENRLEQTTEHWLSDDHLRQILSGRPGSIAEHVKGELGVSGPSYDLYGACAAGNMALAVAKRRLLAGDCDLALAGGSDGFSRLAFIGFMRLRVMADGICRPFDERRDGLLVGEGSAMFVLERESDARARGATILARISGASFTCEDYHPTRPQPQGDGLTRAIEGALADAHLKAGEIDYVCAHGTGTPINDAIEVGVLERCFPSGVRFSSIKALTGHMMGAAAAGEAAYCVLCLAHQTLAPTWNLEKVLDPCALEAVKGQPLETRVRHIINNSAGFGGYNASVILSAA